MDIRSKKGVCRKVLRNVVIASLGLLLSYWRIRHGRRDTNDLEPNEKSEVLRKKEGMRGRMDTTSTISGQSGKMSAGRILLILFLALFTLGFGIIGTGLCYSAHMQEKTYSAAVEGRVIEYRKNSYIGQKRMFIPVVEYQVGNEMFTGETNGWYSSRTFEPGEYVEIGYNPENPEQFYIKGYDLNIMTRLGILFLGLGGKILTVTVTVLILDKNKTDKERKKTIRAGIIAGGIVLFIFIGFVAVAGLKNTLCVFGAMGLFALYGLLHDKRMAKKK